MSILKLKFEILLAWEMTKLKKRASMLLILARAPLQILGTAWDHMGLSGKGLGCIQGEGDRVLLKTLL